MQDEHDDEPLTLEEACQIIFRGNIKPATLRAEARRGRLIIERIGRKDFVTRMAIKAMRELCRLQQSRRDELARTGRDPTAEEAFAACMHSVDRLKKHSDPTARIRVAAPR